MHSWNAKTLKSLHYVFEFKVFPSLGDSHKNSIYFCSDISDNKLCIEILILLIYLKELIVSENKVYFQMFLKQEQRRLPITLEKS